MKTISWEQLRDSKGSDQDHVNCTFCLYTDFCTAIIIVKIIYNHLTVQVAINHTDLK